ncbi:hypothetical protein FACS1894208_12070 [Clostridia bacterium]|nr:hypothetical protein FACS1894208_12070 [Clostridia bacterium]
MKSPLYRFVLTLLFNISIPSLIALVVFVTMIDSNWARWTYIATGAFYLITLVNVYSVAWRLGERDRNLVKFGHLTYKPLRGLWAGLLSVIPFVILAALVIRVGGLLWYASVFPLIPVCTLLGYFFGHRLFRVIDKVIYRGKPRKRNTKRRR